MLVLFSLSAGGCLFEDAGAEEAEEPDGGGGQVGEAEAGPGESCSCDSDCPAIDGHEGICVFGVCMTRASDACSLAGSREECPAGSRCWGLQGQEGYICWPDCDAYDCDGACDSGGSCVPQGFSDCGYGCASYCACEPGSCPDGQTCVAGSCVAAPADGPPGDGPGPACTNLPPRDCTGGNTHCSQLVQFDPSVTPHYEDYPINGETWQNQYRSWLRRDLMMLIDYATAKTLCKAGDWETGNGGALGLGDMSEEDGAIPGTSTGFPGHPPNTHTDGPDIDLAYYQVAQTDNRLRPVCPHVMNGQNQHRCVDEPTILDVWRTALFLGFVFESPRVRVIGVDGQVGPLMMSALSHLCETGWLEGGACQNIKLAYETTNMGHGWFHHHHHHAHISLFTSAYLMEEPPVLDCMVPGCEEAPLKPNPLWRHLTGHRLEGAPDPGVVATPASSPPSP